TISLLPLSTRQATSSVIHRRKCDGGLSGPGSLLTQGGLRAARTRELAGRALEWVPGARLFTEAAMNEDRTAKLYAGQMGIVAVLINVLIDKGVITENELRERFEQAREAAS